MIVYAGCGKEIFYFTNIVVKTGKIAIMITVIPTARINGTSPFTTLVKLSPVVEQTVNGSLTLLIKLHKPDTLKYHRLR